MVNTMLKFFYTKPTGIPVVIVPCQSAPIDS